MRRLFWIMTFGLVLILPGCALFQRLTAVADDQHQQQLQDEIWRIKLSWKTETESESYGYYIYRADSADSEPQCLNLKTPLLGAGTSTVPHKYVYYDLDVEDGKTYYYKIKQVDNDGSSEWVIGGTTAVPAKPKPLKPEERQEIEEFGKQYQRTVFAEYE